jgi:hypothetical protein
MLITSSLDISEAEGPLNHSKTESYIVWISIKLTIWKKLQYFQHRLSKKLTLHLTDWTIMLRTMKFMSIKQRVVLNTLLLIHKMKMKMLPKYLCDRIQYVRDIHDRQLRNSNDLRPINVRMTSTRKMMMYKGVLWYNELSDNTKKEMNLLKFKKECIEHVKIKYDVNSILRKL